MPDGVYTGSRDIIRALAGSPLASPQLGRQPPTAIQQRSHAHKSHARNPAIITRAVMTVIGGGGAALVTVTVAVVAMRRRQRRREDNSIARRATKRHSLACDRASERTNAYLPPPLDPKSSQSREVDIVAVRLSREKAQLIIGSDRCQAISPDQDSRARKKTNKQKFPLHVKS